MDRFFEFLHGKAQDKLIFLAVLAVGGICFVVVRNIVSAVDKKSMYKLVRSLRSNPNLAKEVADSLDVPYSEKSNLDASAFEHMKTYVQSISMAGNYTILFSTPVDASTLLVLTELGYTDFDVNVVGNVSDTRKKSYHRIVLEHDKVESKLTVRSTLYSDATDKFQKEEFIQALFKGNRLV
jgi:hypothetical protein